MRRYSWVILACLALLAAGCTRTGGRTDAQIASDVQNKINSDSVIPDKQLTINANSGVVTISGNVSSDEARNAAANDAAQVDGVKTVVNNLQVGAPAMASNSEPQQQAQQEQEPEQEPAPAPRETKHRPSPRRTHSSSSRSSNSSESGLRTTVPPNNATTASNAPSDYNSAPTPPPAPQPVSIPSGTQISVRLGDELSSETSQVGDTFHGSISSPIMVDGRTVVPTTADVEGRVVDVKSAGRFKGQSDLTIELTRLRMNGKSYALATDRWSKQGNARGKSTAAKVGGGAAVGAILGGIFGGGKGAAIGAAAGAGAGTGVSAATKGQQVDLKPETVLTFQLQNSISVVPGGRRQAMNE